MTLHSMQFRFGSHEIMIWLSAIYIPQNLKLFFVTVLRIIVGYFKNRNF